MRRFATRGFTLWELMVVAALVVFLFIAALENLLPLRAEAERAAFMATVGGLRTAVGLEAVRRVTTGGRNALVAMEGANPVDWLRAPPAGYAGATDGRFESLQPGSWAFDAGSGTLFYRVRYPSYFEGEFESPPGVRFRVILERERGRLANVQLVQLDAADWNTEGSELGRWLGKP